MADTLPSSGDRTVVVHRYGVLTWISLGFNALILLLILIGIVCHPRPRPDEMRGNRDNHHERQDWGRDEHGGFDRQNGDAMHHEWEHHDFGGARGEDHGPGGWNRDDFNKDDHHGWGGGRPGFGGPGFDQHGGPDRFKPMTPPSAEAMTDRFMLMMTQKLALTDQESAQIHPIVQQQIEQFQKDMEAEKAAHQKMLDDAKAKIRPILTPDQQKQFDAMTAGIGTPADATPPKPASK